MDVSIIIVNYNTKNLIGNCINSIYAHTTGLKFEIIVSDNNSNDGSVEMIKESFPNVVLIENDENLGFGRANNKGLAVASGKYIFYLNSDTILLNNAIKIFFDYFEKHNKENIGALGCNLQNKNGETIHSFGQIIPLKKRLKTLFHTLLGISKDTVKYFFTHKKEAIKIEHQQNFTTGEVPYITGADLFVKNNDFAKYDERYFMYNEEVDLQLQMQKANQKSIIIEGPQIIHLEGGSTEKKLYKVFYLSSSGNQQLFLSYVQFYSKNEHRPFLLILLKLVIFLIWINPYLIKNTKKNIPRLLKS